MEPEDISKKASNPKDEVSNSKLHFELVPDSLGAYAAVAFTEGALKYGRYNWRVAGARSSVYRAALDRHITKWWNGEEEDPDTGVPHLAYALACIGIIIDAEMSGRLIDDRPPSQPAYPPLLHLLSGVTADLQKKFKDQSPRQYTIHDTPEDSGS